MAKRCSHKDVNSCGTLGLLHRSVLDLLLLCVDQQPWPQCSGTAMHFSVAYPPAYIHKRFASSQQMNICCTNVFYVWNVIVLHSGELACVIFPYVSDSTQTSMTNQLRFQRLPAFSAVLILPSSLSIRCIRSWVRLTWLWWTSAGPWTWILKEQITRLRKPLIRDTCLMMKVVLHIL